MKTILYRAGVFCAVLAAVLAIASFPRELRNQGADPLASIGLGLAALALLQASRNGRDL